MLGLSRQRSEVLLLVLVVALVAGGCGGGDDATTTTGSSAVVTTAPSGSASPEKSLVGTQLVNPDRQPSADRHITTTEDTPSEVVEALTQGRPVVLLFYVPGNVDDVSVFQSLGGLVPSFGRYQFLIYDYKDAEAYGDLSSLLGVGYPPEVILIDKGGLIQQVWNGYVDEGTLNQGLVNLDRS